MAQRRLGNNGLRVRYAWTAGLAGVAALLGAVPGLIGSGRLDRPWLLVVAGCGAAGIGSLVDHWRSSQLDGVRRRVATKRAALDRCLTINGRLPRVRDVADLTALGVHRATSLTGDVGHRAGDRTGPRLPTYVARDVDVVLAERLSASGFLVLVGDSTAGKSRTALEVLRATHPDRVLVAPLSREALAAAVDWIQIDRNCVLWLDDLERFLGPGGGLAPHQVASMVLGDGEVPVLATLRAEERARLAAGSADGAELPGLAREVADVLRLAHYVWIDRQLSEPETRRAMFTAETDPRIAAALASGKGYGLAEFLAAGPQLLDRWRDGWAPGQHPRGAALVAAAVDCRRAGLTRPLGRAMLVSLHDSYLDAHGGNRLRPERLDEAFAWATTPQSATTALLHAHDNDTYVVFDYLVDSLQRSAAAANNISESSLRIMLDHADLGEALSLVDICIVYGLYDLAETAVRVALGSAARLPKNHPDSLAVRHSLADVQLEKAKYDDALVEYRAVLEVRVATLGPAHPATLRTRHQVARVLLARGDVEAAEAALQELLADELKLLASDHPYTLATRYRLARAKVEQARYDEAEREFISLLDIKTRTVGPHHPDTLALRRRLARIALERGEQERAEDDLRAILHEETRVLGEDHPCTLKTRQELAHAARVRNDNATAVEEYELILDVMTRIVGAEHPNTRIVRNQLSNLRDGIPK